MKLLICLIVLFGASQAAPRGFYRKVPVAEYPKDHSTIADLPFEVEEPLVDQVLQNIDDISKMRDLPQQIAPLGAQLIDSRGGGGGGFGKERGVGERRPRFENPERRFSNAKSMRIESPPTRRAAGGRSPSVRSVFERSAGVPRVPRQRPGSFMA